MRWLFPLLFVLSCGPHYKNSAEIEVSYNGVVESVSNPLFNTPEEAQNAIDDGKKVDFLIFGTTYCPHSMALLDVLSESGWRNKVIVLNAADPWVNNVAKEMNLEGVPAMYVSTDDGKTMKGPIYGAERILFLLFQIFKGEM